LEIGVGALDSGGSATVETGGGFFVVLFAELEIGK
jgi:hypothetical protein